MQRLSVYGLALALLGAACSSTAPGTEEATIGGIQPSAAQDAPTAPGVAPSPLGSSAEGGAVVAPGEGVSTGLPSSGAAGGAPRTRDLGPPSQGVTKEAIKLGFWILDTTAVCANVGVDSGPCAGDDRAEVAAINDWMNAHGGIAGRRVDPVLVVQEVTRSNYSTMAQAACEAFTEDHQVFAVVVASQFSRPDHVNCLAERNTPVVDAGTWAFDADDYARFAGFLYQPDRPRPERWVTAYVDGLARQGFFEKGSTIGLVRFDGASYTRVTEEVLKPRLAAHGFAVAEEAAIRTPESIAQYSDMNAEMNNAILRFRNEGVDRVLFFATNQELSFFFFKAADSQGFRPRYGLSSYDNPAFEESEAPGDQLNGAIGFGWAPRLDVAYERDPGGGRPVTRCGKIFADAGLDPTRARSEKCDNMFFLKAALDRAQALNPLGLRLAVEGLGGAFKPAATLTTRFDRGRYDGPATYRFLAFRQGCSCFRYTSGERAMP